MSSANSVAPTFYGYVLDKLDALILVEACLSGKLAFISKQPEKDEKASLPKSGNVFVYDKDASRTSRWNDYAIWTPSRVLGNFFVYGELDNPIPRERKKQAGRCKRSTRAPYPQRRLDNDTLPQTSSVSPYSNSGEAKPPSEVASSKQDKKFERTLVGSLIDIYDLRAGGLVKKARRMIWRGHILHYGRCEEEQPRASIQ